MKEEIIRTINVLYGLTNKIVDIKQKSNQCLSVEQYQQLSNRLIQIENSIVLQKDFDFSIFKRSNSSETGVQMLITNQSYNTYKDYQLYILQNGKTQQLYLGKLKDLCTEDTAFMYRATHSCGQWFNSAATSILYSQLFHLQKDSNGEWYKTQPIYVLSITDLLEFVGNITITINLKFVSPTNKEYISDSLLISKGHNGGAGA